VGDQNAVEGLLEEVDDRGAKEVEAGLVNAAFEAGVRFIQGDDEVHFLAGRLGEGGLKASQLEEQKALGKGKVLAQQTIAPETVGRRGQERLLGRKTHAPDAVRWQERAAGFAVGRR